MTKIGTTLSEVGKKALLCGSGELGKEVAIELQRYGVEVVALDKYPNAPAMQVAHRSYVLSMLDGVRLREIIEAEKPDYIIPEVEAIEHMFLELYLALVLMTTDFTKLAPLAGQMGIVLVAQGIFMALFGIFVSFNLFGRDYGAAVMTAGNIGWGCGSGSNAVANEKAIMDQYGWHTIAWVLYPSFAVIIDDIYNPIFLSIFGGLFRS